MPGRKRAEKPCADSPLPWRLAAPSCVLPAAIPENCAFLAQGYDEIGLCFFETGACLAYGEADLPPDLALLPVGWHMHLPLDLPWERGAAEAARMVLALREVCAHLSPGRFVLHPPATPGELAEFAAALQAGGLAPQALLVENIAGDDLARHWGAICGLGLGVCLDLGHMLVHGQEEFLGLPGLWERVAMLHLNAPDPQKPARHAPLTLLSARGRALCRRLLAGLAPGGVVVLELFNPSALADSRAWLEEDSAGAQA